MDGITISRRKAPARLLATLFTLAVPLGLLSVAGCGEEAAQNGATIKADPRPEQGNDAMKSFMEKQKNAPKEAPKK